MTPRESSSGSYGVEVGWQPAKPRLRLLPLLISWAVAAASVYIGATIVPGVELEEPGSAFMVAVLVAVLNVVLPPLIAALRLPWTLLLGFVLVLLADAWALLLAEDLLPEAIAVSSFGDAVLASLVIAAISLGIQAILGTNDDDEYTLRVVERVARRLGDRTHSDAPGIVFLEIDGLALPVLRARDGRAEALRTWPAGSPRTATR